MWQLLWPERTLSMHPLSYSLFVIVIVFQQVESPAQGAGYCQGATYIDYPFLGELPENGCQYDCGHDILCDIHQPFSKFVFHSNAKIVKKQQSIRFRLTM